MMKNKLWMALALVTCAQVLSAQVEVLQGETLVEAKGQVRVTNAAIFGIKSYFDGTEIFFSFVHPNGGIQKVAGPLMSGGAEPENLNAFGSIQIYSDKSVRSKSYHWLGREHFGTRYNLYANPLTDADSHLQTPLASPKDIWPYDTLLVFTNNRDIKKPLPDWGEEIKRGLQEAGKVKPKTEVYAEEYYKPGISTGLSGNLSQMTTVVYNLRPKADWNKGLAPGPYSSKVNLIKGQDFDALFGNPNVNYKATAGIPTQYDPASGNLAIMGGLKYKKDKTKDDSEFYEFLLLSFDKDGNNLARVPYETKEPMVIVGSTTIYGQEIAPDVREATHAVFLLRGGGNKNITSFNNKLLRAFVVDLKTGQLVAQNEVEMPQGGGKLLERFPSGATTTTLTFLYTDGGKNGLSFVTLGAEGILATSHFLSDTPQGQSLQLEPFGFATVEVVTAERFLLADNSEVVIKQFIKLETPPGADKPNRIPIGGAIVRYGSDGVVTQFKGLDKAMKGLDNMEQLPLSQDGQSFYSLSKNAAGRDMVSFLKVDAESLNVINYTLKEGHCLAGKDAFFIDDENKRVYFLSQSMADGGLYFHQYRYR